MKEVLSFEQLMEVINGKVTEMGQSGKKSVGAAQEKYFGTRFGANLDVEALVKKCEEYIDKYQYWAKHLQTVIENKREERDKAVAEKIADKADKFKNFSVNNLDAMIARLEAMKNAKVAAA